MDGVRLGWGQVGVEETEARSWDINSSSNVLLTPFLPPSLPSPRLLFSFFPNGHLFILSFCFFDCKENSS